jgi:ketosteroid isomerase-like protein
MMVSRISLGAVSPDAAVIRATRAQQNAAIRACDIDRVTASWTEDVSIRRGLGQLFTGRDACQQMIQLDACSTSPVVYHREPVDVEVSESWPLAFETGVWAGRAGPAGPIVIAGRYSAQWVKREDRWLIRSEVFVALTCTGHGCSWPAEP